MKAIIALTVLCMLAVTTASGQGIDLSGQYRRVQAWRGSSVIFIKQSGWNPNVVNESGEPSPAWIDWPGQIWAQHWNEGARYSPDGMTIQLTRGTIWPGDVGVPPAARPLILMAADQRNVTTAHRSRPYVVVPRRAEFTVAPPPSIPSILRSLSGGSELCWLPSEACDNAHRVQN